MAVYSKRYWLFVGLFILHQILQYGFKLSVPIVDSYLDPLLAPIVLLGAWQFERKWLFGKKIALLLHPAEIIAMTIYVASVGEFLFPLLSAKFHFDPYDFFAYGLGGLLYQVLLNTPNNAQ
ncbi:hypothetical protein [Roseivirga ehrenbergii]|uniref:hypothetical protein n=1 Tax=Roseivirga ehrenbergii (strain DSM 102268 / JCM 13514 / KCTC 12282 / NCIMB 14502 / KMM 6017) TaxID=279360 RepID=UPI0010467E89|nr:hypothetical protein [Roseivirga ehrenbergii]